VAEAVRPVNGTSCIEFPGSGAEVAVADDVVALESRSSLVPGELHREGCTYRVLVSFDPNEPEASA
jgi:hypothetical protein